jgi:hypothetical protein
VAGQATEDRPTKQPKKRAYRPFRVVCASPRTSSIVAEKPRAPSNPRHASDPKSDVTSDPRQWSMRRRSKSTWRASSLDSRAGRVMTEALIDDEIPTRWNRIARYAL